MADHIILMTERFPCTLEEKGHLKTSETAIANTDFSRVVPHKGAKVKVRNSNCGNTISEIKES